MARKVEFTTDVIKTLTNRPDLFILLHEICRLKFLIFLRTINYSIMYIPMISVHKNQFVSDMYLLEFCNEYICYGKLLESE